MRWCYQLLLIAITQSLLGQTFSIATYNLNYANRRGDAVLNAIARGDPDVVCFQETTLQSEAFLRERLIEKYPHFYAAGHKGEYLAERFAFASKTELKQLRYAPPSVGLFGHYAAQFLWNEQTIEIINVHLTPVQLQRSHPWASVLTAFSDVEAKHAQEIESILRDVDLGKPTIILGDFNSISEFVAPQRLRKLGMLDAMAQVHPQPDTQPTWIWPSKPLPMTLRIDYIFHTSHLKTRTCEVLRRDGSDHAMVTAVFEWKGNEGGAGS